MTQKSGRSTVKWLKEVDHNRQYIAERNAPYTAPQLTKEACQATRQAEKRENDFDNDYQTELGIEEVSVYDIKDHPDFKYRPASCDIRTSCDKESESTAGQVVDVHPAGKVEVQWVSGKTSLFYPQELYRIDENDSDDLWDDEDEEVNDKSCSGDDSWETESEK
ncbi:hypothetical protein HPB49_012835 [Dermacentor silvarum]|uniref:Uncharacterized protein n=1 Tax=Dermacentor silvarum TaxID=543639 RepID=A0ACB8C9D4_DERSI|nr:hypothetical protein HPB49_012835 [Dermacentor silvarum]